MLALICCAGCRKTNEGYGPPTIPFVNNDSVQFFYPPKTVYNSPSQVQFNSIVIDNKNNKWMSAASGIYRFDGMNWTRYDSANMPVDPAKYESFGLICDSKGTIYSYLLPFSGENVLDPVLIVYKDSHWASFTLPFFVEDIAMDKWTDKLYFLGGGDSIRVYNGSGSFSDMTSYSGFYLGGNYSIISYNVAHDSVLVFFDQNFQGAVTDSGHCGFLVRNGNGETTVYNYPDDSKQILLNGILSFDGKSTYMTGGPSGYWFYTPTDNYDSFYVHNSTGWSSVSLPITGGYSWLDYMKYSNDGVLWISYGWSGLAKYENGQFSLHDLSDSKPYSHIVDFAFDSDNVKWLACWEGLIRYNIQ
jgi:hypothetical protein